MTGNFLYLQISTAMPDVENLALPQIRCATCDDLFPVPGFKPWNSNSSALFDNNEQS